MTTGLKVAIGLLVAVVAFGAVALFAFSGLFDLVEGGFFQPRVQQRSTERANRLARAIDDRHRINIDRYQSVLAAPHVVSAFLANQSRETVVERRNAFERLHAEFPSLHFVRILSSQGDAIHYSTLPTDIVRADDFAQTYTNPRDLQDAPSPPALHEGEGAPLVASEAEHGRLLYSFPIVDQFGVFRGSGLFYVGVDDLADHLTRVQGAEFRRVDLAPGGILINSPQPTGTFVAAAGRAWANTATPGVASLRVAPPEGADNNATESAVAADARFVLFTADGEFGRVGLIISAEALRIPQSMRWTLLGAAAATLFLLVFLILNLRQDAAVVLADRIKRFQVTFLREFLEEQERLYWEEWRSELALRKAEVKARLTKGTRAPKGRGEESERLFDRSWDEIVGVLAGRAEQSRRPVTNVTVDAAQIEQIVRRALAGGVSAGTLPAPAPAPAASQASEVDAEPEELEALEEVAEAEPEEVEAIEEVAEAEPAMTGPGSMVQELLEGLSDDEELAAEDDTLLSEATRDGELKELTEVPSLQPLPPDRPYEDLEKLVEERSPDHAAAALEAADGAEEIEELEDIDEVEEIKPVETLEEVEEASATEAEAADAAAPFVDRLRGGGKLMSFSLTELAAAVSEVRESVALEDGVYRIKPEIVTPSRRTKSLFRLAERARSSEVEDPSMGGPQGIGDLFGGGGSVDSLFGDDAGRGDQPETLSSLRGASRERRLPVTDAGLDLDQLLRQYPRPKDETTLVRCLVNLSRPLDAVGAVLMEWRDDAYVATQTVGLMEGSAAALRHAAGSELYDRHLGRRDGVLMLESLGAIHSLAAEFVAADVELVKRLLYLPVRSADTDGYLLLASREDEENWDLPLLVEKLVLYLG